MTSVRKIFYKGLHIYSYVHISCIWLICQLPKYQTWFFSARTVLFWYTCFLYVKGTPRPIHWYCQCGVHVMGSSVHFIWELFTQNGQGLTWVSSNISGWFRSDHLFAFIPICLNYNRESGFMVVLSYRGHEMYVITDMVNQAVPFKENGVVNMVYGVLSWWQPDVSKPEVNWADASRSVSCILRIMPS